MNIKIPPFLKKNSLIGITAPSFGCTIEPYKSRLNIANKILNKKNYSIKIGQTVTKSDGLGISTKPEICAKELEDFWLDNSVDAIISAGGGELMCETVEFINFKKLSKAKPKWFIGYSDNTNFIFPLVTISKTAAIYGPCISGFGKKWEQSEKDAFLLIEGKTKKIHGYKKFQKPENDIIPKNDLENYTYNLTEKKMLSSYFFDKNNLIKAKSSDKISINGILLGGCLDVLANLCGTKLDNVKNFIKELNKEKIIWVLESCDASPMELRRQIWHLKNANWFKNAAGFLIGRPLNSFNKEMMGVNQYNAILDILSSLKVPIIMDCDIGHIDPAMPLIMGAKSQVKVQGNNINIEFII